MLLVILPTRQCVSDGAARSFRVSNGVRQGGILSPHLFNVYVDDPSQTLTLLELGVCQVILLLII